ncbi:MAG: histidine kinase [Lachnospiraceae bacterium]|jgi:hypothetical protein|nr:histidine kinase [Lachnospiraceae bacterium]
MKTPKYQSRLAVYTVLALLGIVAVSMLFAGLLFYNRSAQMLTEVYRAEIARDLQQMSRNAEEQIADIDALYMQITANQTITDSLDLAVNGFDVKELADIEREQPKLQEASEWALAELLTDNHMWGAGLLMGAYIFDVSGISPGFAKPGAFNEIAAYEIMHEVMLMYDPGDGRLFMRTRYLSENSVFFYKNIYSAITGEWMAGLVLEIDREAWGQAYLAGTDENWLILLYNDEVALAYGARVVEYDIIERIRNAAERESGFQEVRIGQYRYLLDSYMIEGIGLRSVIAAPRDYLLRDLDESLASFIGWYALIALASLGFAAAASFLATRPLHRRRLLQKDAEFKALQAQITPHFLFNVLNTIAWKAEIEGKSDIYQMALSLGELLRANIHAKDKAFVTLGEELEYVKYYVYLQQQRFGEKFTVRIDCEGVADDFPVPRFCLQPLVENAILHGLEPMPEDGREYYLAVHARAENGGLRLEVRDNGQGFPDSLDLGRIVPSGRGAHAHIGLKNLRERLLLLGGRESKLTIAREGSETVVSFWLAKKE